MTDNVSEHPRKQIAQIEALLTSRGDEYGEGWNAAVRFLAPRLIAPAASPVSGSAPHPDTVRIDVLQSWMVAANFAYPIDDEHTIPALIFELPTGVRVGADLRAAIDAARGEP